MVADRESYVRNSRPKNLGEVSAQEHTVAVLKKTLESANVCRTSPVPCSAKPVRFALAPSHAFLWSTRNGKDFYDSSSL